MTIVFLGMKTVTTRVRVDAPYQLVFLIAITETTKTIEVDGFNTPVPAFAFIQLGVGRRLSSRG